MRKLSESRQGRHRNCCSLNYHGVKANSKQLGDDQKVGQRLDRATRVSYMFPYEKQVATIDILAGADIAGCRDRSIGQSLREALDHRARGLGD